MIAQLEKQLEAKTREFEYAQLKIQILEEHLRLRRIAKYGPGSEKLSNLQLQLLEEETGVSSEEVQAESQRESQREKRACKNCEEQGVAMAPLPPRIIDKSLVSDEVIIDTVVSKYANHCPLYRQSVILLRDAGIDISRATMCGWVMTVGEMLSPVVGAMRKELLVSGYIQADETPVDVQTHDKRGKNHQGYLWQYGTPGGGVVFDFRMNRGREGPKQFLGHFEGILQTDDYIAYERGLGGPKMVHACCWSHARRHFVDAIKLNKQDAGSLRAVELMDKLFSIDVQAREEKIDHAARHLLRQEKAPSVLNEIHGHILATRQTVLPGSKAGQACKYTLTLWEKLTRFLDHPRLELSNSLAENSMRLIGLGRKNWIHIGSPQAGQRVAAILSVIESCRRLKVPVRQYLGDILPGLDNKSIHAIAGLTPAAWAAQHAN